MMRTLLTVLTAVLLSWILLRLLAGSRLIAPRGFAAEENIDKSVDKLIKDLGSDRFAVREAATRALMDLEDEPYALHLAMKSADLEVRLRISQILESHGQKRAPRSLKRACSLAKQGRVDEMLERLVFWKERNPKGIGEREVAEFAARLAEWEHRTFGNTGFLSKGSRASLHYFSKDRSWEDPITPSELAEMFFRSQHHQGREIVLANRQVELAHLVILASEKVRVPYASGSLVISGGSVHMQHGAMNSIIICDGDLVLSGGLSGCLVIAREQVTCNEDSEIVGCTILSTGPVVCPKGVKIKNTSMLREDLPISPVKFFDPELVGLSVWQLYRGDHALPKRSQILDKHGNPDLGGGVWVENVQMESPLAARLRKGDVITAIEDKKTPTTEIFRRILRRKLAEGGPGISITVCRAGKTLEVPIPVKD